MLHASNHLANAQLKEMSQNISVKLFTRTVITHESLLPESPGGRTKYPVKMHQCSGARKTKTSDSVCDYVKVFIRNTKNFFHSVSLFVHLPSVPSTSTYRLCLALSAPYVFHLHLPFIQRHCLLLNFLLFLLFAFCSLFCVQQVTQLLNLLLSFHSWLERKRHVF